MEEIARDIETRHRVAFPDRKSQSPTLDVGGRYQWRRDGEYHLFNPDTVHKLQKAVRTGDYKAFQDYSKAVNEQFKHWATLRGLLDFKSSNAIPIDEMEP